MIGRAGPDPASSPQVPAGYLLGVVAGDLLVTIDAPIEVDLIAEVV